jgi:FimV-like protein
MTKRKMMNEQQLINLKLELARAWIQNGHEDMARSLVKSIIERDEDEGL